MTREEAIHHLYTYSTTMGSGQTSDEQHEEAKRLAIQVLRNSSEKPNGSDLISRQDAINEMKNVFDDVLCCNVSVRKGLPEAVRRLEMMPSAEPKIDDESELKFYYVESIDDYWIGRRLGNFYYADWHEGLGFVWSKSRYLPWGEHIVDENTLWKEHTYPSEPIEIPFTEWIVGFVKKYFAEPKTGEWILECDSEGEGDNLYRCSKCGCKYGCQEYDKPNFCPNCGADMRGADE